MKTHDRIDTGVREYIPTCQNKTARQIQAEIDLMRLAYAYRMNVNQPRRDRMVGWCLLAIMAAISATVILAMFLA